MSDHLTRKDFVAPVSLRWCPGCGDFAIINALQNTLPTLGIPKENFVIVSGIGCASRLPYYMNTYGFHTIHGRAPTVATGIKIANPHLSVWVITGDGDGLSIGGNHLIHALRRNIDLNILMFNNQVYGLTKGQFSPTSGRGAVTKTSPDGSLETPINPVCLALAAEATFVARTVDTNPSHMIEVFSAAARHKGTAFVEILQNCVTFNNKVWDSVAGRNVRDERMLLLEHGKPLIFGKNRDRGIRLNRLVPEVVSLGPDGSQEQDLLVHDTHREDPVYHHLLGRMAYPSLPVPIGIFRDVPRPPYERELRHQVSDAVHWKGRGDLQRLLNGRDFWLVSDQGKTIRLERTTPRLGEESKIMDEQIRDVLKIVKDPLTAALRTPLRDIYEIYAYKRAKKVLADEPLSTAVPRFKIFNVSYLMVMDGDRLIGILSERDVVMKVVRHSVDPQSTPARDLVGKDLDLLDEEHTVGDAINLLSTSGRKYLPIQLRSGRFGVITAKQILWFIHESVQQTNGERSQGERE